MKTVEVDDLGFASVELFRAALSERSMAERFRALRFVVADRTSLLLESLNEEFQILQPDPDNLDFLSWVASTAGPRTDAAFEIANLIHRYKKTRER